MVYFYHYDKNIPHGGIALRKRWGSHINYLGFLALLALIAFLAWPSGNNGLLGFLGFLYFARYFRVIPDELFLLNLRRAATTAFLVEMFTLVPLMFLCTWLCQPESVMPWAFGLSFAAGIISFSLLLAVIEWRERRGEA